MLKKYFAGQKIIVRKLAKSDIVRAKEFRDYFNSLVAEDALILMNRKISLKEERKWLKRNYESVRKKKEIILAAEAEGKIVGMVSVKSCLGRQSHVGEFAIGVKKGFRGRGLGEFLGRAVIKAAQKELKPRPKIIRLCMVAGNKPAERLYLKLGFRQVAAIPKQLLVKGKYRNEVVMLKEP